MIKVDHIENSHDVIIRGDNEQLKTEFVLLAAGLMSRFPSEVLIDLVRRAEKGKNQLHNIWIQQRRIFGVRLMYCLEMNNYELEEIALELKIPSDDVELIRSGEIPSVETLEKLEKRFKHDLKYWFGQDMKEAEE